MRRSLVEQLPQEVRQWLEGELLRRGFADYLAVTDELNAKLEEAGHELRVSKSSLQRWGVQFADKLEALRRTTEMGKVIARDIGDDEGAVNEAVIRLVQDRLFTTVMENELGAKALGTIAHAVADLSRSAVVQKKYAAEVRSKATAAAASAERIARKGGLSADMIQELKREILGIAS